MRDGRRGPSSFFGPKFGDAVLVHMNPKLGSIEPTVILVQKTPSPEKIVKVAFEATIYQQTVWHVKPLENRGV